MKCSRFTGVQVLWLVAFCLIGGGLFGGGACSEESERPAEAKTGLSSETVPAARAAAAPVDEHPEIVTSSGLKYRDIKVGDGAAPEEHGYAKVHYIGWLTDGKQFDSSYQRGKPVVFWFDRVIAGWAEGVRSMRVGGKRRLEVPPHLAYGDNDSPLIPANSTLIFEIELLDVRPPARQTAVDGLKRMETESGLTYWDIRQGSGAVPGPGWRVKVNYAGWLADGTLIDSSYESVEPAVFALGYLVPGLAEGIGTMAVGGKRRMVIPPALAYGDKGSPPSVPAGAEMIYEVELLDVIAPPAQTPIDGIEPVQSPSGLKYWDIKVGEGPLPNTSSVLTAHYSGWLEDGTLFDSSVERGVPATFRRDLVPDGWKEGVWSMRAGGVRRLLIPHTMAFGDEGKPPKIPPRATVIYEVELLAIQNQ